MEEYIRIKDVLNRLDIKRSTLYNWLNPKSPQYKPDFPKRLKIGAVCRFKRSEFEAFIEKHTQK